MRLMPRFALSSALAVLATGLSAAPLQFQLTEGQNLNAFYKEGPVAAHLLLRSGQDPRILVAFPAGNSGVGLWFAPLAQAAQWRMTAAPVEDVVTDAKGRKLYGIAAGAEVTAPALVVRQAILSSVRVLRDYQSDGIVTKEVETAPVIAGNTITWARARLDGAPGYRLALTVTHGTIANGRILAGADGVIGLRIAAQSGETPLTPIAGDALLNAAANPDPRARNTLDFLAYREKFLAGSWRFDTYFGRDTMMSLNLLMPALQPVAMEGGIRSVIARLSPTGEAAHEEGIGEFAVLDHLRHHQGPSDAPEYDYAMIDSTYMLAPLTARWLVEDPRGRARAAAFLAAPSGAGGSTGAALLRNLRLVMAQSADFAAQPTAAHLLAIKSGRSTGEWRDSNDGLGLGRYPYDVNAVLVPAALRAVDRLAASGLLAPYMMPADRTAFAKAAAMARTWTQHAPGLFDVAVSAADAHADIAAYATAQGVPAAPAEASIPAAGLRFHALSLNADGSPVRVVHSDDGFALMFGDPDPASLNRAVTTMMRPFPAGLLTDVGLLVANPVYGTPADQQRFTRNAYHGLVVWSWQQALLAAGLDRQLRRTDLPAPVRANLAAARKALWQRIEAERGMANSELWSWTFAGGKYQVAAYGAAAGDADEANAAQLWSSAFLALKPPRD